MELYEVIFVLIGFLDLFGVSMVITCIPSYLVKLDVTGFNLGIFMSLYGAIQLFSSSVMGYIADVYGKKSTLKLCAFCAAISYFVMAFAHNFQWLLIARSITGLFKHTLTLSNAVLSSYTTMRNRDRIMGYFAAASSSGFLFGPPLGGWLYDMWGFKIVCYFCGSCFVLIFICLNLTPLKNLESRKRKSKLHHYCSVVGIRQIFALWDLYALQFFMGTAVLIFRTSFSTAMKQRFDAPVFITGLIISSGSISGVIGGMSAGYLMNLYDFQHIRLVFDASVIRFISMLGCTFATNIPMFVIMQLPLSFSNSASKEAVTSLMLARINDPADTGKVLGFGQSLMSFSRLATPFFGSLIMDWNILGPSIAGTICASLSCFISMLILRRMRNIRLHED